MFLQPFVVPVTVYIVFTVGATIIALVVEPVFQEYVLAPLAVNVAELPEQIVELFTVTFGVVLTVTVAVF